MPKLTRRRFLKICAGTGTGVGLYTYTWRWEPHRLEIVERQLPIANLPNDLVGRRLAQISDIHIGPQVDDDYLLNSFQRVQALAPDYIAYTGDFITHTPDFLDHFRHVVPSLPKGLRGSFAILGNHDYGRGWDQPGVAASVVSEVSKAGIRILRNEVAEADGLHFVGMDDLWADRFLPRKAISLLPLNSAALALSHNPDTVDLPDWDGFSGWILAGHTHGGQCKPPFLPPPLLPVRNRLYTAGEFPISGNRRMYINRGLGTLLPVRFNVRPEITVFHLARA